MKIFFSFLKLGALAFGGPLAALGLMEDEYCLRRKWLTASEFAEILAICKLLPGPITVQMAIAIGRLHSARIGRSLTAGGALAGIGFILPAFLLVLALSYSYNYLAGNSFWAPVFQGMQAAALGVILVSAWRLGQPYAADRKAWIVLAVAGGLTYFWPRWEPVFILAFGLSGAWVFSRNDSAALPGEEANPQRHNVFGLVAATGMSFPLSLGLLGKLFWVCFKAGAFVFGTGLAVVPMLEADVVRHYHWITHSEFMDALAIGQITPGPVVITATFIGFKAAGLPGALVASAGMFLPSFINILVIVPLVWNRIRGTRLAERFSAWAIPAVIGGILAAVVKLGELTLTSAVTVFVFLTSLAVLLWRNPPAWALIPSAGAIGLVLSKLF